MKIEIIKGNDNDPVAEFFSSSSTPETDKFKIKLKTPCGEKYWVPVEHSERMERERDDALSQIFQAEGRAERFCQERDEAKHMLDMQTKIVVDLEMRLMKYEKDY